MEEEKRCVTQIWSRVTGFFRPLDDWNRGKGKDGEFSDRKKFKFDSLLYQPGKKLIDKN